MTSLYALIAYSILALLGGGLMGVALRNSGWGVAALKGLMASFLGGLILFHLMPHAYEILGASSLLYAAAGFAVMIAMERLFSKGAHGDDHGERFFTAEMLWVGLVFHQITDGVGLAVAASATSPDFGMALAVIAHRIPVAAVVIWLFYKHGRARTAWLRVGAMAVATLIGALLADGLIGYVETSAVKIFYAFIAGSLLHLFTHDFLDHHAHKGADKRSEFFAFVVGALLFIFAEGLLTEVPHQHVAEPAAAMTSMDHDHHADHHHHGPVTFSEAFVGLIRETAPYLLLGLLISGLLQAFMPASPVRWLQRGRGLTQSLKGMAFGLPLPVCSCGVLPLFLSLSRKGAPPATLIAFLIATPELGVDSFLISVKLLGWEFSSVRLVVAMILPVVISLIAIRFLPAQPLNAEPPKSCCHGGEDAAEKSSWWRFATMDLVDDIFPFIFFGLFIAALAQVIWPASRFPELVGQWDILILGALGIPFYVCASASVPFALILLQHGFSVGAVVVFMFAGPATNVATILTVNKAFGKGSGLKLATTAFLVAVVTGFTINAFYAPEDLDVFQLHEHGWTWLNALCVSGIAVLGVLSLYRNGPLHWISTVVGMIPGAVHHPKTESAASCH